MILGIDASNIRAGGGVTHMVELLRAADPLAHDFSTVIVWGGQSTLRQIEERPWLVKSHQRMLDKGLPYRIFWQRFRLARLARAVGCDVLFVPGGSYAGDFQPVVTLSQNLLPFEWCELKRFGWSWMTLKFLLLRFTQGRTFRRADGVIFLTQYAQNAVMRIIKTMVGKVTVTPHGVDRRFICPPREQLAIGRYSFDRPFRILYVSSVFAYKHQWHAATAVTRLRQRGVPVTLDLVGSAHAPALKRLMRTLERIDPLGECVRYSGIVPYEELHARYAHADLFLFASSCENLPNILIEAMAAGLPIACSNRGPMPDVLGSSAVYFDPEKPVEIESALKTLVENEQLRGSLAVEANEKAKAYSWQRCADDTFSFFAKTVSKVGANNIHA